MKVINLQLEERVLGIVRARSEIAHCSVAEIIRMAIQAAWKEQTGRDLPTYVPGSGGRRRSSRYESKYATVSLPPQWHAWIRAHAGCVAPWVKQAMESFVLRPFVHSAPTGKKPDRSQAMPLIQSRWPEGRQLRQGQITGRLYVGGACAA